MVIFKKECILTSVISILFSHAVFAEKVDCGAYIKTEYNIGYSAGIYVGINISAKNTTKKPIDGVTWIMRSKEGKILFNNTWVGANQRMHFAINPTKIGVVPIGPGDTSALVPTGMFNHVEATIRDQEDSDGTQMKKVFDEQLEAANNKYSNVSCEVLGFVKKINF